MLKKNEVRNRQIRQKIIADMELLPHVDKVPSEYTEKILPVYQTNPEGEVCTYNLETTTNDVSFQVPEDEDWQIQAIRGELLTNATVGNRRIQLIISQSGASGSFKVPSVVSTTASNTTEYIFMPETGYSGTAGIGGVILGVTNPCLRWITGGSTIRIFDHADVSATDEIDILVFYRKFKRKGY